MQTEQIDKIREMFRNDDGSCKLSRSDVLRIVDKLAELQAAQQGVQADGACTCRKISIAGVVTAVNLNGCPVHTPFDIPWCDHANDPYESCPVCEPPRPLTQAVGRLRPGEKHGNKNICTN